MFFVPVFAAHKQFSSRFDYVFFFIYELPFKGIGGMLTLPVLFQIWAVNLGAGEEKGGKRVVGDDVDVDVDDEVHFPCRTPPLCFINTTVRGSREPNSSR